MQVVASDIHKMTELFFYFSSNDNNFFYSLMKGWNAIQCNCSEVASVFTYH